MLEHRLHSYLGFWSQTTSPGGMKPVARLVRFKFGFYEQTTHVSFIDTLYDFLLDHLLCQFLGAPITDGALYFSGGSHASA